MSVNPTVKEVALRSGVSTATVSRVVNRDPRISSKTSSKVWKAIEDLNYSPNPFARGLKTSKSRAIGFIAPEFANDFFMGIAKGVESRLREDQYSLVICNANENVQDERDRLVLLLEQGVDGIIVIPSSHDGAHFKRAQNQKIPVVLVDRLVDGFDGDAVLADNVSGTYKALEQAISEGIREIAFIGGNQTLTSARERYDGYRRALEDSGISFRKETVLFGDFHADSGYRLMGELMSLKSPPACVFISNYFMHVGATRYLMERRDSLKLVPEIISFDEMELSFTLGYCRTIVRQPILDIGRKAAELLLGRISGRETTASQVLRLQTDIIRR